MFRRIKILFLSLGAAQYAFQVSVQLSSRGLGLESDEYDSLPPFFRKARIAGLSPVRCANKIQYFLFEVDKHILRDDPRSLASRNGMLFATIKIWDEAVVGF